MIKAVFHTNLEEYSTVNWPPCVVAIPNIGDWVQSLNRYFQLQVVEIIHCYDSLDEEPYLNIELHRYRND